MDIQNLCFCWLEDFQGEQIAWEFRRKFAEVIPNIGDFVVLKEVEDFRDLYYENRKEWMQVYGIKKDDLDWNRDFIQALDQIGDELVVKEKVFCEREGHIWIKITFKESEQ